MPVGLLFSQVFAQVTSVVAQPSMHWSSEMHPAWPEHAMSAPQHPAPLVPVMHGPHAVFVVKDCWVTPQAVALSRTTLPSFAPESFRVGPAPAPTPGSGVPQLASSVGTQSPSSAGRGLLPAEQATAIPPSPAASAGRAPMRLRKLTPASMTDEGRGVRFPGFEYGL
jgi:hypothetical protein